MYVCVFCVTLLFFFSRELKGYREQRSMGIKKHSGDLASLGQRHQGVNTNVEGAFPVIPFKFLPIKTFWVLSMPIMNLKDGNASVAILISTHNLIARRACSYIFVYKVLVYI